MAERTKSKKKDHRHGWTPFQQVPESELREQRARHGGMLSVARVYRNNRFCVLVYREVATPWGRVERFSIRNATSTPIPWAELQRIKNDVAGPDRQAVQVFPRQSELVDEANMYHLWVLLEGECPLTI